MPKRHAKRRVETLVSAGGVVHRRKDGRVEVVLCGRTLPEAAGDGRDTEGTPDSGAHETVRWSLAKGTPAQGETLEETALREVREETGLQVEIESPVQSIAYWFASRDEETRYHKTVHYYLMVPVGGGTELHDLEFDFVRWFPVDEALKMLTYPNEADVLRRAVEIIGRRQDEG